MPANYFSVAEFMDSAMGGQLAELAARRIERNRHEHDVTVMMETAEALGSSLTREEVEKAYPGWDDLPYDSRKAMVLSCKEALVKAGEKVDFVRLMSVSDEIAGKDRYALMAALVEAFHEARTSSLIEKGYVVKEGYLVPPADPLAFDQATFGTDGVPVDPRRLDEHEYQVLVRDAGEFLKSIDDIHYNPVLDPSRYGNETLIPYCHCDLGLNGTGSRAVDDLVESLFLAESLALPSMTDFMDGYVEWCARTDAGPFVMPLEELKAEKADLLAGLKDGAVIHLRDPETGPVDGISYVSRERFYEVRHEPGSAAPVLREVGFSHDLQYGLTAVIKGSNLYADGKEPTFTYNASGMLEKAVLDGEEYRVSDVVQKYFTNLASDLEGAMEPSLVSSNLQYLKGLEQPMAEVRRVFTHAANEAFGACLSAYVQAERAQRAQAEPMKTAPRSPEEYRQYREGLVRKDRERGGKASSESFAQVREAGRSFTPKK